MKRNLLYSLVVVGLLAFSPGACADVITIVLSRASSLNVTNAYAYPSSTNILIGADSIVEWGSVGCDVSVSFPIAAGSTNFGSLISLGYASFQATSWDTSGGIRVIAGPAMLTFSRPDFNGAGFCALKVTKLSGTFTPSSAVVIPSDAQGPVDILLESSTNFVDWVQALPGTYGTSSQVRYFRVRAVRQ
ncbi:MAG: hypothetical protein ABSC03_16365 [Verrucomicrobiota bacterium]